MQDHVRELLDQCNSDDPIDQFEALEELWNEVLHQGTPGEDALEIVSHLLGWLKSGHAVTEGVVLGIAGWVEDLAKGPTHGQKENSNRVALLAALTESSPVLEPVLDRPCVLDKAGRCDIHGWIVLILLLTRPDRAALVTAKAIELIRSSPASHQRIWESLEELPRLDGLSAADLALCLAQTASEPIQRAARVRLASFGDPAATDRLIEQLNELSLPRFGLSLEEIAILTANPASVSTELLTHARDSTTDSRGLHDLARTILRKAADDQRTGWDLVTERRADGQLVLRHPSVPQWSGASPPQVAPDLEWWKDDLLRNPRIKLIDTDLWQLFGLAK